jgi:hypothetical protein
VGDELLTELLTRALRDAGLDARHVSLSDTEPAPEARPEAVARVFLQAGESLAATQTLVLQLQQRLPRAQLIQVCPLDWLPSHKTAATAPRA